MKADATGTPWLRIVPLAAAALVLQGYHFGVDDAEIYIPAVKRVYDPGLYPFGSEFFLRHAGLSLFAPVVGGSARILHVSVEAAALLGQLLCFTLLLAAVWQVAGTLFRTRRAQWGATATIAGTLSVPVAGAALVLMDPYVTARTFSTPFALMAIAGSLRGRAGWTVFWVSATALFHPQMAVYALLTIGAIWVGPWIVTQGAGSLMLLPNGFTFHPVPAEFRKVLYTRTFFFAGMWQWYEWIGVLAPLLILETLSRVSLRASTPALRQVCRGLVLLGILATGAFLLVSFTPSLESFARVQPMRAFLLIYLLLLIVLGGLAGQYVLRGHAWRWLALFLPLAAGMVAVDRAQYTSSPHVEWPGARPQNPWLEAFAWVRENTPKDAVFALNPNYMAMAGEDRHGFRALAERSALADSYKDSGVVVMFPALMEEWQRQQRLQAGWEAFTTADFRQLARRSQVTWVVVEGRSGAGLECPYKNRVVSVCRVGNR